MPRFTHDNSSLPSHVLAEVDSAWERAQDRFAGELELHFDFSESGLVCELRVPGGEALERLTAAEALAIACGDAALVPHALAA